MGMPDWWGERRYGIYFDISLATVPAWAPIGASAERYRNHLGETSDGESSTSEPLVEVLAHHRDRWGHIGSYDDFAPLLDFDGFDGEEWAEFAVRCGAGYAAVTAKHHDGWCWWDAPGATETMVDVGPRRNVLAEFAAACERNDLVLGGFYSLDDVTDGKASGATSGEPAEVAAARLEDLIGRLGFEMLFGDMEGNPRTAPEPGGRAPAGPDALPSGDDVLVDRAVGDLLERGHRITTYAYDPPTGIVADHPWQLCRPIGPSLCHNRTEREAHQLSAVEIVTTLTEVVAKGGNLMLGIGPAPDGTISGPGRASLLDAAAWIRRHEHVLRRARPWSSWGDDDAHYWVRDDGLHVADISGRGRFGMLDPADHVVDRISQVSPGADTGTTSDRADVPFDVDDGGVHLASRRPGRRSSHDLPLVYRVEMSERERAGELFEPAPPATIALAPLLAGAEPGAIVQLGDAAYSGPATVPPGVTLRGLGPDRTRIGTRGAPLTLEADTRLEHLGLREPHAEDAAASPAPRDAAAAHLEIPGADTTVLGCTIDGPVAVTGDGVTIRATRLRSLRAGHAHHLRLSHCTFRGDRWSTAVDIVGGGDNEIDSCEFTGHRTAVHVVEASGTAIAGSHIEAHHCGVHLERADHAHVHRNLVTSTMRAVDVDGGSRAVIDGNAVFDGDSGCIVRGGATECEISGNHWERCRIGVLGWNAGEIHELENHAVDLYEPEHVVVTGP